MTPSRSKTLILCGLLGVLAVLLLRDRIPGRGEKAGEPAARPAGSASKGGAAAAEPDWNGLVRMATAPPPAVGIRDLFNPESVKTTSAGGPPGKAGKVVREEAANRRDEPPSPEPETPLPPGPEEVRMAAARAELAEYRFVGVFRKSGGERVAFFAKGKDIVSFRKGDPIGRSVQVAEVRDADLLLVVPPDRRFRVLLKGNTPLSLP